MSAPLLLGFVLGYFALLLAVACWTSRRGDNDAFFIGNRNSPWGLVAFGMIGTSLSGVTFVSVPGTVALSQFSYLQIIIGQVIGYALVAFVLLPLYYRHGLISIYGYLQHRLGPRACRTGAGIFIVSRTLGATARLYLVVAVLQTMILDAFGVPFWLTSAVILVLILLYTMEGGVRTIVYTDTLQTAGMLLGLIACTVFLLHRLDLSPMQSLAQLHERGLSRIFGTDPLAKDWFVKQIVAGIFITIAMTGLDQEMMQKSLSVRRLADSQKNLLVLAVVMLLVVSLFLYLGGLLSLSATAIGLQATGDKLFPTMVLATMPVALQVLFVVALVSALFPSADGALTALTSSFCIDLLGVRERHDLNEARIATLRRRVHLSFAALFMTLVMGFHALADPSMIGLILKIAAYTYGPLLGLFAFGILTRRIANDRLTPVVALAAPALCWAIDASQQTLFGGWQLGLELLLLNGALTFAGMWLLSATVDSARSVQGSAAQR
ncbi:MAG: sodium:solute symporter [Pseudomonadota bacterium]|nr:sodium:solute symporter [Pseudomonadota bacterium]